MENKLNSLVDKVEKILEVNNKIDVNLIRDLDKKVEESILIILNMFVDSKVVDNLFGYDKDQVLLKKVEKLIEMLFKKFIVDQNEE